MNTLPATEQLNQIAAEIAEEIINVKADTAFKRNVDLVEGYWGVGEAVVSHPKYAKYKRGQGELCNAVANIVGMSERSLATASSFSKSTRSNLSMMFSRSSRAGKARYGARS
jgi:hypothetical protein